MENENKMKKIIIIGASKDKNKFGNKALRAYKKAGYEVFPINPKEESIEGLKCYKNLLSLPEKIDLASLYLPPKIGINIIEDLPKEGVKKIYLNPGTDSPEIIKRLKELNIEPLMICSILAIGMSPSEFS